MNAHDAIRTTLGMGQSVLVTYLSDLEDKDLVVRPVEGSHHIAFQLGHLITTENSVLTALQGKETYKLPDGFAEAYSKENAVQNDPSKFHSKAEYLRLMKEQRQATIEFLETVSESDLDKPGPERFKAFAPTIGEALLALTGGHQLMHAGQLVAVRRKLGKPVLI